MEMIEILNARVGVLEHRVNVMEERWTILEQKGSTAKTRRRKELSPEERQKIRQRLVAGKAKKAAEREAEAKKAARNEKKEAENE